MSWAFQRQVLIGLGLTLVFGGVALMVYFAYWYSPASCDDQVQNQDETGVDCGGSCALLCEAPNIREEWVRAVPAGPGVFHVVGLVRNPDTESRGEFTYEVSLFDSENILIARRGGSMDVEPGEVVPVFVPLLPTGERIPARAAIQLMPETFERAQRFVSPLKVREPVLDTDTQRLTTTIENTDPTPVSGVGITALIFNPAGTLIAASKTRIEVLGPRERREIFFTWPEPFSDEVGRIDIFPRVEEE